MVNIIVVSHSRNLANAIVEFVDEMKGDGFEVRAVSGIDSDENALGSDPIKIMEAINELYTDDGVLLLGDIGSSIMNIEMAIEMLPDDMNVRLADAPIVEGALAAVCFNSKGVSLDELKAEAEAAKTISKI